MPAAPASAWNPADPQLARLWRQLHGRHGRSPHWSAFDHRLRRHLGILRDELAQLYGDRADFEAFLCELLDGAFDAWSARDPALRALDARREEDPTWFQSERMVGGVCYVDRYGGTLAGIEQQITYFRELGLTYLHLMPPFACPEPHNDGGYAVTSYRDVAPRLGTIDDLRRLAVALREAGIALVLDFVFNHTADDHAWARAARSGDPRYRDYYIIFPDRTEPDRYERTLREIFPDEHPGAFSPIEGGQWVWTTFHSYQWDLNYANPGVFTAMAGELLFLANLGTQVLRMDAVAFIWKQLGTSCENLPQAHTLLRAYNALARIAAPSLVFKSEAIVHPDDVVRYVAPAECQLSYNPLQMALLWNSLATRDVGLLQLALEERHALPAGTAWINYVRSHDDIGWTFADEDARRLGIDGHDHRQFLNRYYVDRFEGSFARGVPFQDNPATGDCRISGTCASLAGIEQDDPHAVARILLLHGIAMSTGGIPLLYLGDEVGTPNDPRQLLEPGQQADSRWVHRPRRDAARYARIGDVTSTAGRIHAGLSRLIALRQATPALAGGRLVGFRTHNPGVLGYTRPAPGESILVLANFTEHVQAVAADVFSAQPDHAVERIGNRRVDLRGGVVLAPYALAWLHVEHPR